MSRHWHAVVIAGGAGTRFWPASRKLRPKQLLALGPGADEPLIQGVVRRLGSLIPAERILIATGEHLAPQTAELLPALPKANILAEPVPRNTAPCILWATRVIHERDPQAVIAVLSADHLARDEIAFSATIEKALTVAASGIITTIGLQPTRPETGYGYIELGKARDDGALEVLRFVEKPSRDRAEQMLASGRFLWNSGFFFFRSKDMLEAAAQHLPDVHQAVERMCEHAQGSESVREIFPKLPSISIDYGVMEKLGALAVVPGDFGWTDIGSWQTVWELAQHDAQHNAAPEGTILIDASGNMVADLSGASSEQKKTIALLGVRDLVVVDTGDALLVIPRERCQEVRDIIAALKTSGRDKTL